MTLFDQDQFVPRRPAVGPPPEGFVRLKLVVAYDGRGFHGVAPQPGVKTVGGVLAEVLARILGHDVWLTVAGRTDAGVHAWGQVVSLDARAEGLDLARVQRSVNKLCGPAIAVRSAEVAGADFDARRSARARRYRYMVLNRPVPDPLLAGTTWHVAEPLDLAALRLTCDPMIGEHDFTSFCRASRDDPPPSMVRTVYDAGWSQLDDDRLRFEIEASSFCQQMVRSVVGTMVAMGAGRRRAGEMAAIIRARDRSLAAPVAPAHGLCLWEVSY